MTTTWDEACERLADDVNAKAGVKDNDLTAMVDRIAQQVVTAFDWTGAVESWAVADDALMVRLRAALQVAEQRTNEFRHSISAGNSARHQDTVYLITSLRVVEELVKDAMGLLKR